MNLQQLEYLVATCKLGSISAAAAECHVTQQAVSNAVKSLEKELGITLLQRSRNGVLPTSECNEILESARRTIEESRNISAIASMHAQASGTVRIAIAKKSLDSKGPRPHASDLDAFEEAHPNIKLERFITASDACLSMLDHGSVDLAIAVNSGAMSHHKSVSLSDDEVVVVGGFEEPLGKNGMVSIKDLDGLQVIPPPEYGYSFEQLLISYKRWGLNPQFDLDKLVNEDLPETLVARREIVFFPHTFAKSTCETARKEGVNLQMTRVMPEERYTIELRLCWLADKPLSPAADLLRRYLEAFASV